MNTFSFSYLDQQYVWQYSHDDWPEVMDSVIVTLRKLPLSREEQSHVVVACLLNFKFEQKEKVHEV